MLKCKINVFPTINQKIVCPLVTAFAAWIAVIGTGLPSHDVFSSFQNA
jgi:hypothetical protein